MLKSWHHHRVEGYADPKQLTIVSPTVGYPVKRPKRTVSQFCRGKLGSSKIAPENCCLEDEFPFRKASFQVLC